MDKQNIESLDEWHAVEAGDVLEFPARGSRRVRLAVNSNGLYEIWVAESPDMAGEKLAMAGDRGQGLLEYTSKGTTYVQVRVQKDTAFYLRGFAPDQRVDASYTPVFTNVEPRTQRNSDLERMMYAMRLNDAQRQKQVEAELSRLRATATPAPVEVVEPPSEPEVVEETNAV